MSLDKSSFVRLKIFFRVHIVGVLLDFMCFGLFTKMHTLFEIVLNNVHFSDDSLNAYEFISHFAPQTSGGDEVPAEIAFKTDFVVFNFGVILGPLVPENASFKVIFGKSVIPLRVFDEIFGCFRVFFPQHVNVNLNRVGVWRMSLRYEIIEVPLVVLYVHLAHN